MRDLCCGQEGIFSVLLGANVAANTSLQMLSSSISCDGCW